MLYKDMEPKIVHLSFSNDPDVHFEYMRIILKECYGNHSLHTFDDYPKDADLYITEHFMSTKKKIITFPYKRKAINVIHSMNCWPKGGFLKNIVHTNHWKKYLAETGVKNIEVIPGGLNLKPYRKIKPDYSKKVFGRLTRWNPVKIPIWWNDMVKEILDEDEEVKCLMYIDVKSKERKFLKHERMIYSEKCKITDFKGKYLKNLSLYVHANGSFKEILSNSLIEAMATGLPIIYKDELSLRDIVGDAGIRVNNQHELKYIIKKLLGNELLREAYGILAKERAEYFDVNKTVNKYNKVIKECLGVE